MDSSGTKRCARCGQEKPLVDFARKRARDFQPYCRPCQSEYKKEHYRKNKTAYRLSVKRRRDRLKKRLRTAKDKPCADCGVKYPYYVMDFDHRDANEKLGNVTQLISWGNVSEKGLLEEIAKCDVICANCHRERTHRRRQYLAKCWK
jgi:hypothetical protein